MKQPKKILSRMALNNWGGISHKVMEFHEHANLFSGKSGSGKSTVMDAIQVVLYGSVSSTFLNKAADDAKNKRSVLSYLRGAQKDGSFNRENKDFCSGIVLEIFDTGRKTTACIGAVFEVGKQDQALGRFRFFSHSGGFPDNAYVTEDGLPYTIQQIRQLTEERRKMDESRERVDVNRVYPSKESYLAAIYDGILGYLDPGRLMTMEKSAIALRMTSGTGQFIRDYMFPRSEEDTVSVISDQLGAYREIKERVDDLENRVAILDEIQQCHLEVLRIQTDKLRTEKLLRMVDIEGCRRKIQARQGDLDVLSEELARMRRRLDGLSRQEKEKTRALVEVGAKLKASDYGQKEKELEDLQETMELTARNFAQWREILQGLREWEKDEKISGYLSNPALQAIEDLGKGNVDAGCIKRVKRGVAEALENINEELKELDAGLRAIGEELKEKEGFIEDLRQDRKPYRKDLKTARAKLQDILSSQYGRTVRVEIFADLFDVTDAEWKDAIEGRLGRIKYGLVVPPEQAADAEKAFRKLNRKETKEIDLINTAAILRDHPDAQEGTLYEAVHTEIPYVDLCLKHYLGGIQKCGTEEELNAVRDGVVASAYSYSNRLFCHLRQDDYGKYACIGTKVSRAKLRELEEEVYDLKQRHLQESQACLHLRYAQNLERLNFSEERILFLAASGKELEKYQKRQQKLTEELEELADGTLAAELRQKETELEREITALDEEQKQTQAEVERAIKEQSQMETELSSLGSRLEELQGGFVPDAELQKEIDQVFAHQPEHGYRRKKAEELARLESEAEEAIADRGRARNRFNHQYPGYGFDGYEADNGVYDRLLERCRKDFEPDYKKEFEKQYQLVYHTLRENVIATIHGEIKAAYRHKKEINRMLSKIRFSDSIYQIDILPAENENGQFYDMLMAAELDSKAVDNQGFEGQISLGEDEFYGKYEAQIKRLTEKFMPPREEDAQKRSLHKQQMEQYADYRNYLTFSMYERVETEDGTVRKNYVDEMAGRDSGGEGQNPKYVALLAGFAMLYMQQGSRDPKIRLVLLDEAFSKMDQERSEVCLRYARELELQLIVCVPDERLPSLIRNVDSVYGFRRYKNQISMMHIDKGKYMDMVEGE